MANVFIKGVDLSSGQSRPITSSDMVTTVSGQQIARLALTADTTFYVRTDGNDSNDGLTNDSSGAFLTIQAAVDNLQLYDCSSYVPTIQVGDGTYANGVELGSILGSRIPRLVGNTGTPANVVIQADDTVSGAAHVNVIGGNWEVEGFSFQDAVDLAEPTPANYVASLVRCDGRGTIVTVGNCRFGPCNVAFIAIGGTIKYKDNLFFEDDIRSYAFYASRHGLIQREGASTITCVNSRTVNSFIRAEINSTFETGSDVTFINPGNYTGNEYQLIALSLLYQFGTPVNGFPGAGNVVSSGSQVV